MYMPTTYWYQSPSTWFPLPKIFSSSGHLLLAFPVWANVPLAAKFDLPSQEYEITVQGTINHHLFNILGACWGRWLTTLSLAPEAATGEDSAGEMFQTNEWKTVREKGKLKVSEHKWKESPASSTEDSSTKSHAREKQNTVRHEKEPTVTFVPGRLCFPVSVKEFSKWMWILWTENVLWYD